MATRQKVVHRNVIARFNSTKPQRGTYEQRAKKAWSSNLILNCIFQERRLGRDWLCILTCILSIASLSCKTIVMIHSTGIDLCNHVIYIAAGLIRQNSFISLWSIFFHPLPVLQSFWLKNITRRQGDWNAWGRPLCCRVWYPMLRAELRTRALTQNDVDVQALCYICFLPWKRENSWLGEASAWVTDNSLWR